jgi:hypothetical protein
MKSLHGFASGKFNASSLGRTTGKNAIAEGGQLHGAGIRPPGFASRHSRWSPAATNVLFALLANRQLALQRLVFLIDQ